MNTAITTRKLGTKLFNIIMAFVLAVGIGVPVGALANPEKAYGAGVLGEVFTDGSTGVTVTYKIIDAAGAVQVGSGAEWSTAIATTTGKVTIPDSVTYKGTPYDVTVIGEWAFFGCTSLATVTLPTSLTSSIGDYAFAHCWALKSLVIPSGVTQIGKSAFFTCTALKNITIPDSVSIIGLGAFVDCSSLKNVTIPNVSTIKSDTFSSCSSLTNVTIPNGVTAIESGAFGHCTSLKNLAIPASVGNIGGDFIEGSGITSLTFRGTSAPNLDPLIPPFNNATYLSKIYVPAGCVDVYKDAWRAKNVPETVLNKIVESDVSVTGLSLSDTSESMGVEGRYTLVATITPSNATNQTIIWSSDTPSVATVGPSGEVTALSAGSANITATSADNLLAYATCAITVASDGSDVVTVTAPATYAYKAADKAHTLQLSAKSSKGNSVTEWILAPTSIAAISSNGLLTFNGTEGEISVSATTKDGISAAKKIKVVKNVTGIATPQKTLYIQSGKSFSPSVVSYDVKAKISPKLTWSTSNKKIAEVKNGKITIAKKLKKGKVTITAKAANGKALSIKVNVSKKAVKLKKATVKAPKTLKLNKTKVITVKFSPKKATGVKITFKSSKAKGLEVDKAGKLTAKKKGNYKITIKCGTKKIVKKIKVK